MLLSEIQIRDPFVLPVPSRGEYFLYGTTDKNCWGDTGVGFDTYRSRDLQTWDGPIEAFRPAQGFWATKNFWAPEVYEYRGKFYMFASFKAPERRRGTQVLIADAPEGPFVPWSEGSVTPADCECLDGTLHVDESGNPWMVFCHEWVQIRDGAMCAVRLAADLRSTVGAPITLFYASQAPWKRVSADADPIYVTDGPFLHRTKSGALLMLWSSFGDHGYAMGLARSKTGQVASEWTQDPTPLWSADGGHGMFFRAFDGTLYVTLHQPNKTPLERATFHKLIEDGDSLRLAH